MLFGLASANYAVKIPGIGLMWGGNVYVSVLTETRSEAVSMLWMTSESSDG